MVAASPGRSDTTSTGMPSGPNTSANACAPAPDARAGVPSPRVGHGPEQRHVREACVGPSHERRELVLQRRRRRVQVGVDRAGSEVRQRRLGRGERGRRRRQGEHDRASGDRRAGVTGSVDALRRDRDHGVVAANLDADGDEVGGESTAGLAETEHRDHGSVHG